MVIDMKRCANDSPVTHVITVTLDRNKSLRKNGRTEVRKQKRRGRSGWSDRFPCVGALLTTGPMQQWPNRIRFSCCNRMNQLWCWCCCYGQHYLAKTLVMLRKRQLPLEHPRNRLATDCQRRCWWKWSTWSKWNGQMKMTSRLIDPSTWMWHRQIETGASLKIFENSLMVEDWMEGHWSAACFIISLICPLELSWWLIKRRRWMFDIISSALMNVETGQSFIYFTYIIQVCLIRDENC